MPAVEERGLEPVPAEQRTGTWRGIFAINVAFFLNPLMYVIGALAVTAGGLPFWWAIAALLLGQAIAFVGLATMAELGSELGLPGQVGMRAFFGFWGARTLSSGYRAIAATYWFAAQAIAAGLGVQALLAGLASVHVRLVPTALVLAAVQGAIAVLGFDVLRWVTRVVLPLALVFVAVVLVLYFTTSSPKYQPSHVFGSPDQHFTWSGFAAFLTVTAGSSLTFIVSIADFTRYTRSRRDSAIGLYSSALLTIFATTFIGAYAAVATGQGNPFVAASELTTSKALLALLLLALLVQSTGVNIMNVYSVGFSLLNTAPRLGRLLATALAAAAGFGLSAVPDFVSQAQRWITHLGNVASPLTGVLLAEYLVRMRRQVDVDALYSPEGRYRYVHGVNLAALTAIAAGVAVYYAVSDAWVKFAWGVGVSAAVYLLAAPLQDRLLARAGDDAAAIREAAPLD